MRHVLFGTLPKVVGRAAGCLIGESMFFFFLYLYFGITRPPDAIDEQTETAGGQVMVGEAVIVGGGGNKVANYDALAATEAGQGDGEGRLAVIEMVPVNDKEDNI